MTDLVKYIRFHDLKDAGIVNNRTTLCRWIKAGHFPPGRLIGPNSRAWTIEEVANFQQRLNATASAGTGQTQ
jgi:hypothetical protein